MDALLEKLINRVSTRDSQTVRIITKTSSHTEQLKPPIELKEELNYEAALIWFSAYNTIFNITPSNNNFSYSTDSGVTFKTVTLTPGAYEITNIDTEIKRLLKENNDYDYILQRDNIEISIQNQTSHTVVNVINPSYRVFFDDIKSPNNIRTVLGFDSQILNTGYNVSNIIANILQTSSLNIKTNLVEGAYTNGIKGDILYSYPTYTVPVGFKILIQPNPPIYYPVTKKYIPSIFTALVDEDNKEISFNGEEISMFIHIRQVK